MKRFLGVAVSVLVTAGAGATAEAQPMKPSAIRHAIALAFDGYNHMQVDVDRSAMALGSARLGFCYIGGTWCRPLLVVLAPGVTWSGGVSIKGGNCPTASAASSPTILGYSDVPSAVYTFTCNGWSRHIRLGRGRSPYYYNKPGNQIVTQAAKSVGLTSRHYGRAKWITASAIQARITFLHGHRGGKQLKELILSIIYGAEVVRKIWY